jgi:hypothetical protein
MSVKTSRDRVAFLAAAPVPFLLSLAACRDAPATAVVVALSSEAAVPGEVSSVHITVMRGGTTQLAQTVTEPIPGTLTLDDTEHGSSSSAVEIRVAGVAADGTELVVRRARLGFVKEKTKLLRLRLERACFNVPCVEGQTTCIGGECIPADIDAATLPDFVSNRDAIAEPGSGGAGGAAGGGGNGGRDPCPASGELAGMSGTTFVASAPLATPRHGGFAVWLPELSRALVAGGFRDDGVVSDTADLLDPIGGTTTSLQAPTMQSPYFARLQDGRVLAGGSYENSPRIFDPATSTWTAVAPQLQGHTEGTAIVLDDGRVLVVGGGDQAELFDPVTSSWTATQPMAHERRRPALARLADGRVLAAGGMGQTCTSTTEVLDPATGTWTPGPAVGQERSSALAATLSNGDVVVFGGARCDGAGLSDTDILKGGVIGAFVAAQAMAVPTDAPSHVVLTGGKLLVAVGYSIQDVATNRTAQVFDPAAGENGSWTDVGPMLEERMSAQLLALPDGRALVAGGAMFRRDCGRTHASVEIFVPK